MEGEVFDQFSIFDIREADMFDIDVTADIPKLIILFGDLFFRFQKFKDPLPAGQGVLKFRHDRRDVIERFGVLARIRQEDTQVIDTELSPDDLESTDQGNDRVDHIVDRTRRRIGQR